MVAGRSQTLRRHFRVAALLAGGIVATFLTAFVFEALTDRDWAITDWEWPEIVTATLLATLGAFAAGSFVMSHVPSASVVVRALAAPRGVLLPGLGTRLERHPRATVVTLELLRRAPGRHLRTATLRSVALPLVERMKAPLIVPVAGGNDMRVAMADIEGRMLATSGVWEPQTLALLSGFLQPGDVFVDLGAHLGFFSLYASRLVGVTGRVYAVEPAPESFRELEANLTRNAISNVEAREVAAGAATGEAVLNDVRGEVLRGAASIKRSEEAGRTKESEWAPVTVRVEPVTEIVDSSDLSRIRLIKVDVEGAEIDVLEGIDSLYAAGSPRPSLLVEVHSAITPDAPRRIADFCSRHDLRVFRIGDALASDRNESARRLNAAVMSVEELVDTPDDHFYVVLTDEALPESSSLAELATYAARAATADS